MNIYLPFVNNDYDNVNKIGRLTYEVGRFYHPKQNMFYVGNLIGRYHGSYAICFITQHTALSCVCLCTLGI